MMMTSKAQLTRHIRNRLPYLVIDDSNVEPIEVAIYTLSDPRDLRQVRYVGQTICPNRRYLQHVGRAQLWLPDEIPWWIKSPKMRPLYEWIRDLYRDEYRLPVMMVVSWTQRRNVLQEEQRYIQEYLSAQLPLLNREGSTQRFIADH